MPDKTALDSAVSTLVGSYTRKLMEFNTSEFLRTGVDPFRFTFNVSVWGLERAIQKEIEHKLEMALENAVGQFHEDYLGNTTRAPKGTKWRRVPAGQIPGADIANEEDQIYLQVKSKHNSMNSSSSARLAQELEELKSKKPRATVGCAWVIATSSKSCIGEKLIRAVGKVLKGKEVYEYVTGKKGEMDAVLQLLPDALQEAAEEEDLVARLANVARTIAADLQRKAGKSDEEVIAYICSQSVD